MLVSRYQYGNKKIKEGAIIQGPCIEKIHVFLKFNK